ncbi:hypothetical protein OpiT1DRAFT_05529 [Opitutaceae bacterium TAV1]|nr:hypothetical protein OpiT1DRAFT_05529 [Opitutaceae bacterium TAV1]
MFTPKNHDLSLPDWGPYSKCYAGASHIADRRLGLRFDLSVFPALYRRRIDVPNVTWESGWHPWECGPAFEYFSTRHELVWKDKVYADIAWFPLADGAGGTGRGEGLLARCEFVNATARGVPVALHAMASMNFPTASNYSAEALRRIEVTAANAGNNSSGNGGGVLVKHSLDYDTLDFAVPAPDNHLVADGLLRGEVRGHGFLDGSGLGGRFGRDAGDTVRYTFALTEPMDDARLVVRGRGQGSFRVTGFAGPDAQEKTGTLAFAGGDFRNIEMAIGKLAPGQHSLRLEAMEAGGAAEIAFLALVPAASGPVTVVEKEWSPRPEILRSDGIPAAAFPDNVSGFPDALRTTKQLRGVHGSGRNAAAPDDPGARLILKYPDAPAHYGIAWDTADFEVRQILNSELDSFVRYKAHDHVNETLRGNGEGHFTNVFIRPVTLAPKSRTVIWGLVCQGTPEALAEKFALFFEGDAAVRAARHELAHRKARRRAFTFAVNPAGRAFAFSQNRMAATTLSNAVFPVYTQRQQVRHRPPGRWWNSLYTWDSGFIGLGLLEIDAAQAEDNLSQYLTAPGNPHAAFIHHGSMVPMQIHLAHEVWNRLGAGGAAGKASLKKHYASLRQYYRFLAGHAEGSTLRTLRSDLLRSWDYFYNSGWDDYPPQKHMHEAGLADRVTPVVTTALAIRCAKTLALAARELGEATGSDDGGGDAALAADVAGYEADIAAFGEALERHAWDAEAGYYSYVVHDADGNPAGPLRHPASGTNYNRGLDGLFPLVAGAAGAVGDAGRRGLLLERLFDPARVWTEIGLTAVDRSAPYYRRDGYWSGTVWFPQQWFFWKTMLDLARPDLALAIAQRALETWRAEVDESYHCFEHFLIETGRGCGWHQFSGLSTPVMIFYAACYCPGRLSVGFDAWVRASRFSARATQFESEILFPGGGGRMARSVLVCMRAGPRYRVTWNGGELAAPAVSEPVPGLLAVTLAAEARATTPGRLEVRAVQPSEQPTPVE